MTTKFNVAINGTAEVFLAFSAAHPQFGHVVTLVFWTRTGAWANGTEIHMDAGGRTFWDTSEAECFVQLHEFVKQTWGGVATITPV